MGSWDPVVVRWLMAAGALAVTWVMLALATLPRVEPRGKRVFRRLKTDKKTTNGVVHYVLPTRIGAAEIVSEVPDGAVVQAIEELRYLSRA